MNARNQPPTGAGDGPSAPDRSAAGAAVASSGNAWSSGQKPLEVRRAYIEVLRRMSPAQRLAKAFELTANARQLLKAGLRAQHPGQSDEEIHRLYLARLAKCYNCNY